jgi:hypothetical protein
VRPGELGNALITAREMGEDSAPRWVGQSRESPV